MQINGNLFKYLHSHFWALNFQENILPVLKYKPGFDIKSFTFKGQGFTEDCFPQLLFHSLKNANYRNEDVVEFAEKLDILDSKASISSLLHYQYFQIKNKSLKIIIRPEARIEHGWLLSGSTYEAFSDRNNADDIVKISKQENSKLLYTISIERV